MTEKQKYLLKLFREVDEICREHNLRYVLAGGSLIGTLRHEGFVPWDDDVDLYMPRPDWEKFIEICKTELPPDREIQCSEVDRNYTNSFPRYASTNTCAIHKSQIIGKDCGGEIIDILTLDPVPADDKEYEKYRTHMMIYSDLINISVGYSDRWEIPASMYLKYLLSYIFLGKKRTLAKLEKIMFSYKEEECDRYAMRWGGCPFLFDKDMMFPVKEGNFEGQKAMIPNKCSDYLIWHYGDEWAYMPPHDKREGHVAVCVDDLPYQELREEYMPKINKGRLRWDCIFRKFYNMRIAKKSHKVRQEGLAMKARAVALDLQGAIDESGLKISELVENRSFRKLSALFGSYYKNQLSADFIGREDYTNIYAFYHPTLVEIPDDVFYAAMLTLFYTERVSKAYRMMQVRQQLDHLSPEMEGLKEDIELFRKAADHYEFHRIKEAEQIVNDLLKKYPGHPGFMKFKCRFLMENAGENRIEAERFLDKALKQFPEDGYFLKYKADIFWMDGEVQKAAELYLQVKEKTTNGIVWMEMDRFFRGYKSEILKNCEELLANRNRREALSLMELWNRLIPEDDDIRGALYLAKTACAHTQSEIEKEIADIRAVIETPMRTSVKTEAGSREKTSEEHQMYRKALTKAWRRLGYPKELANLRTQIICTGEESELEWLAEQVRNRQFRKEEKACVYKLVGDVQMKQGQTKEAFSNYKKALEHEMPSYLRTELYRIFINDLNDGSRQAKSFGKKADIMIVLDNWLGKYGSIDDIKKIVHTVSDPVGSRG
ncbi:MAG: LicD family protein [Eubacteriales bacterium]|nr:LicD family protein [Eubacteriales bacterium]